MTGYERGSRRRGTFPYRCFFWTYSEELYGCHRYEMCEYDTNIGICAGHPVECYGMKKNVNDASLALADEAFCTYINNIR